MNTNKKKHFFKMIITQGSRFADAYNIMHVEDILPDQVFRAQGKPFEWCVRFDASGQVCPGVPVFSQEPVIHFCDNAIDLLMWYYKGWDGPVYNETYFFEVEPIGAIYKNQCNDKNHFWQCGANKIKIVRQVSFGELLRVASDEIKQNLDEIINRYPEHNMLKLILHVKNNAHITSK